MEERERYLIFLRGRLDIIKAESWLKKEFLKSHSDDIFSMSNKCDMCVIDSDK